MTGKFISFLFFLPNLGMKHKNSTGKTVLIILVSLLAVGALVGGAIAIKKYQENKISTITPTSQETSKNDSSSSIEKSDSSNSSVTSITNSNQNESVIPTINSSLPQEVYWYNTEDQVELNESLLVATINGLPANATDDDRELYFWSDDDDLDEWIEIYRMKNGSKQVLNSPYSFQSGETIHIKQVRAAPATGFYKIPLWIYAVNYEPEQVYNCVDFWFQQR